MIPYEKALSLLTGAPVCTAACERLALSELPGRVCAEDVFSSVANPPFDNAAMDGFAVRVEDLAGASGSCSAALKAIGHVAAGDARSFPALVRGTCYEIMTGAALPEGCDAVIPVEKAQRGPDGTIVFPAPAAMGENIRRAGEDVQAGDRIAAAGDLLTAGHVLAFAALGIDRVHVARKPLVALISTGRELVDDLRAPLAPGQIRNATGPYLKAALAQAGAEVLPFGTVADEPAVFGGVLARMLASGAPLLISTGAVSAGAHDFVPDALKAAGAEIVFHKVAIKPGKPILFARFPGGPLYLGLPGNPASTAAGMRFFATPLLRAFRGQPPEPAVFATLRTPFRKAKGLCHFVRATRHAGPEASCRIDLARGQQSFMVRPFAGSDVWALFPEETEFVAAGSLVRVFPDF